MGCGQAKKKRTIVPEEPDEAFNDENKLNHPKQQNDIYQRKLPNKFYHHQPDSSPKNSDGRFISPNKKDSSIALHPQFLQKTAIQEEVYEKMPALPYDTGETAPDKKLPLDDPNYYPMPLYNNPTPKPDSKLPLSSTLSSQQLNNYTTLYKEKANQLPKHNFLEPDNDWAKTYAPNKMTNANGKKPILSSYNVRSTIDLKNGERWTDKKIGKNLRLGSEAFIAPATEFREKMPNEERDPLPLSKYTPIYTTIPAKEEKQNSLSNLRISTIPFEEQLLYEQNEARKNPKGYIKKLMKYKPIYDPNEFENAVKFLETQEKMPPLEWEPGLSLATKDHANTIAMSEVFQEITHDPTTVKDRMKRYGDPIGAIGDNIIYGGKKVEEIIVNIIIDQYLSSKEHRKNLFGMHYQKCGIAHVKHETFVSCSVFYYAHNFIPFKKIQTGNI